MRTPITLQEFLFTLNQDEDIRVRIIDYEKDKTLFSCWKSDIITSEYQKYKDWFVQDFIVITEGIEITIVKFEKELD